MNNKHYVGKRISALELYDNIGPITGVALLLDDENELLAGDDSGYMLEVSCPYGTKAMAENILSSLSGKTYQGYRGENAILSPAAELGDGITVNGVYSLLAHRTVNFGPGHMSEIAAPGESAMENEYKWVDPKKKEFDRKLAVTRSLIEKNSEAIALRITSEDAESLIQQQLDSIELSVTSADGKTTSIKLSEGGTIDLSGLVTFSALSGSPGSGTTKINGGWIDTDTLTVKAVQIVGEDEETLAEIIEGVIDAEYIYAMGITATELRGQIITLSDEDGGEIGHMDLSFYDQKETVDIYSKEVLWLSGGSGVVMMVGDFDQFLSVGPDGAYASEDFYSQNGGSLGGAAMAWDTLFADSCSCCTSDENRKNSIEELPEKYLVMFDHLTPYRFKMNNGTSGRYHPGYTAQNVKAAMDAAGIESTEFGGWIMDVDKDGNEIYMLRYEEFGAIYAAKIKQLESRVAELEERL